MRLPPYLVYLKIKDEDSHGFGMWLPVFLLWPLVLILFLIVLPFLLLADFVLYLTNQAWQQVTTIVIAALMLLPETRGMAVDIHHDNRAVKFTVL
jgi:hypothetical protein